MEFIYTGGTIDSYYDTDLCTPIPHEDTIIDQYLKSTVNMNIEDIKFTKICMKDSRQINDLDREEMVKAIENSEENKFVITHGTYTLFETALYIQRHLKRIDVTVTLTGSLIPLTGFSPTDAGFNIAGSMMNSELNENGVYVFIKGQVWTPGHEVFLHS